MPSPEEAMSRFTERHIQEIKDGAAGSVFEGMLPLAAQVKARNDADDLVAFLLKYFFTHHRMEKVAAPSGSASDAPVSESRPPPSYDKPRSKERSGSSRERGGSSSRDRERPARRERPAPSADEKTDLVAKTEETVDSTAKTPAEGTPAVSAERPPRERRERGPKEAPKPLAEGHVRLWVNIGRTDKMNPEELKKILEGAGAPAEKAASVDVRGNFSFVDVAEADAAGFEAASGKPFGTRKIKIERAKPA